MLIGIDAHLLGRKLSGNATYTVNLLKGLAEVDKNNSYRLYIIERKQINNELFKEPNFRAKLVSPGNRWIRYLFSMGHELIRDKIDVLHTQYFSPLICPSKLVLTIHDLSFKASPEWFSRKDILMFESVGWAARKAQHIIAVSEFTKREILARYNLPQNKVTVIYEGVSDAFRPITDPRIVREVKKKYNLPEDFILYVGQFNARKNLLGILRAFKLFKETTNRKEKLVLAGEKVRKCNKIYKSIADLDLKDEVIFSGYVPENDLAAIYNISKLFVSLSFCEGFGLPALEAMACGKPVITSNTSAFPEVIGAAGIMVDPLDAEAAAKSMTEVLQDRELYGEMSLKALSQAKKFCWLETARKTLEVYKQVYKGDRQ